MNVGASQGFRDAQTQQSQEKSAENLKKQADDKAVGENLKTFQAALQSLPEESEAPVELAGERPAKNRQTQPARTPACHRLVRRQRVGVRAGCVLQVRRSRKRCHRQAAH